MPMTKIALLTTKGIFKGLTSMIFKVNTHLTNSPTKLTTFHNYVNPIFF